MTSKEALKSMCNHCEKLSIRDGFIGCPYRCISNDYCEEFEIITKDLEVLKILKNHFDKDSLIVSLGEFIIFCIHKDDKDFNKIKEWLEDENNT